MNVSVKPYYAFNLPFENDFNHKRTQIWMAENWTLTFYFVAAYLFVIFSGKFILKNRQNFQLRRALLAWNVLLAIFSFIGACRTAPELIHVLRHYGFAYSICVPSNVEKDNVAGFWTLLFVLSKVPELIDTVFVVLRKQPLIFLHWYHHSTVLVFAWYSYAEVWPMGRWFAVMNYSIHSLMYAYYALRAARFRVPRPLAMVITMLQLLQMIVGCALNIQVYNYRKTYGAAACNISQININAAFAMYFSYLILFARLFYKSYMQKEKGQAVFAKQFTGTSNVDQAKKKFN